MKKFEEVEIVVRRLDNYKEARITLPSSDPYNDLAVEFDDENWSDTDYEIVDVEDRHSIFLDFKMYGYVSLDRMNDVAEKLSEIDDINLLLAINEAYDLELKELLDSDLDNYTLYEDSTAEDYAYTLVDEGVFGEVTEKIQGYIDYEKIARDLEMGGDCYETSYGVVTGHY